jgi:2-polyprenyl-6-methoxyphenol hydroxylase-like FAD-dependent oxidoreductase
LGDACHATLPYVGQGANQAIEDAIVLADCLWAPQNERKHKIAFQDFFQRRSRRTRRVVRMANWMDKLHHTQNPLLVMLRDSLFVSFVKGNRMIQMIEKEIVEECPIKDYEKYR